MSQHKIPFGDYWVALTNWTYVLDASAGACHEGRAWAPSFIWDSTNNRWDMFSALRGRGVCIGRFTPTPDRKFPDKNGLRPA